MFFTKIKEMCILSLTEKIKNLCKWQNLKNFNQRKIWLQNWKLFVGNFVSVIFHGKNGSIKKFACETALFKLKFMFEN